MVAKKIVGITLLSLACSLLFACKGSENNIAGTDIGKDPVLAEHPFKDGYYISDNYTLQFVYIGNHTENSYGISVLDNNTGSEEFFGVVYNVSPTAVCVTVPGYSDPSAMLFADMTVNEDERCVIKLSDLSDNGVSAALCGEYEYGGTEWQPEAAKEAGIFTSGVYSKDNFTLKIDRQNNEISFSICNEKGSEVFNGSSYVGNQDTVMIGSENNYCRFVKCQNGDGVYIDVSAVGYYKDCDYFGKYVPTE